MKKCSYCGEEYPDDVLRCPVDQELLPGGEIQPPPPEPQVVSRPVPPVSLTDWQTRLIELVLVCLVAFSGNILSSLHAVSADYPGSQISGNYRWLSGMVREGTCLGLLWYVLRRSGRTYYDLGFSWARRDLGWSVLLRAGGSAAFYAVYYFVYFVERARIVGPFTHVNVGFYLFGASVPFLAVPFQFLNPFFEELIVRAYVMTEVRYLTNSVGKAIFVSTALQAAYHLYQGIPQALGHAATFLIFSVYYARTRRITPLILAHLYSDVGTTLMYFIRHPN